MVVCENSANVYIATFMPHKQSMLRYCSNSFLDHYATFIAHETTYSLSVVAFSVSFLATQSTLAQQATTASVSATPAKSQVVNSIAVIVNDEVITKQELNERQAMVERRLKAQGTALPDRADLQKQLLERMIVDRAQLQLAKENGMRVDDVMLDRAMLRMAEQQKMTLQQFRNQVEREG